MREFLPTLPSQLVSVRHANWLSYKTLIHLVGGADSVQHIVELFCIHSSTL